ncbi:hypothetical protein ACFFWD_33660 [Bradyrhizobium erythrophlei]|uniref:hypothetical protein n=1 Tax=Bradyrhizobium erythrophlei TaxID=1437360 RepID=UPI0035EDD710
MFQVAQFVRLPPYVRHHWSESKQRVFFRFEASTRMRQEDFPMPYLTLGTDLMAALSKYDREVLPLLEARSQNSVGIPIETGPLYGTLAWASRIYQGTVRFKNLAQSTQRVYHDSIRRCCTHVMQSGPFAGRSFGDIPMTLITPALVDDFYQEYLFVTDIDQDGNTVQRKRSRLARGDIHTLRAMVNAIKRKHAHLLPKGVNPFAGAYMPHRSKGAPAVTLRQLATFVRAADCKGLFSLSAIVLFAWEMEARVSHFPYKMTVSDYRGPHHEEEVLVRAEKVYQERYFLLRDDDGKALYPALIERLDKLKGNRTSGPLFVCEESAADEPRPWTNWRLNKAVANICKESGLPHLTPTQFRTGGLTESGTAGLTTTQIMSQSIHLTEDSVQIYIEKNQETAMEGQKQRLRFRKRKAKRGIEIVT